ncbi:two-component system histidine kinase PnpS [Bacillus massilinigeriensis]|uniref:two-component system histidine kinase PnpS n=1 Tax=Bacillus mediterraneensis TaxID=1805474 RepID=UPI0008F8B698|nr:HAMP domain-containing sensor histidine kinase [Bacillus mediterraneensis]
MTKYRMRLFVALASLLITVMVILGFFISQAFRNFHHEMFNRELQGEADIAAGIIEKQGNIETLEQTELKDTAKKLSTRILVFHGDKNVFDSNDHQHHSEEGQRKAVEKALQGSLNKSSEPFFHGDAAWKYYPLSFGGNKGDYFLLLERESEEYQAVESRIWSILGISIGLAMVLIIFIVSKITNRYTKPIDSATNVAMELAKGNYRARTYEDHSDETGMLGASINILARNLEELMKAQEMQQDRLSTLIESMGSGLILIDSRGYINLINRAYKDIFDVEPADYLYKLYYEVVEHKEIRLLIEDIFMTEQRTARQVVLPLGIERRHFHVYGVPIIGMNNVWKGVLLVFHDITELKKLEQMRKDFVANVSHELKTPITSIKGFTETLLDGAMNDRGSLEAFLPIILKESERLQTLVQDLLDLSKLEQQGFYLDLQEINIVTEIKEVIAILQSRANEKQICLEFTEPEQETTAEGDANRLKQVFINLISNAIAYTPNGGLVSVAVRDYRDGIIVKVKDTGIGIEKEEIPRIFERFYRVDRARSRNSGGTGLGLAIVKHIVEAHKGSIQVKSEVGKGTVFYIRLKKKVPK